MQVSLSISLQAYIFIYRVTKKNGDHHFQLVMQTSVLKWNGGAGSLIRVGLRESEGEERETMILVNDASQY